MSSTIFVDYLEPAIAEDIRVGDILLSINGEKADGMSLNRGIFLLLFLNELLNPNSRMKYFKN